MTMRPSRPAAGEQPSRNGPPPTAAGALPVLGHLVALLRDPLGLLSSLPAQGDLVQVRLGPVRAVVICDPGLTSLMLRSDRTFDKGGPVLERGREVIGNGLGTCPHGMHRRQRRLIQPAFRPDRLREYARTVTDRAAATVGSWQDGQILDVPTVMQQLTSGITTDALFSTVLAPDLLREVLRDVNTIMGSLSTRIATPLALDRLPTPGNRRYHRARVHLPVLLRRIVTDRRADSTDHGDLLSMLMAAHDPESGPTDRALTDAEIVDQILTFFFAATETSASALAWALHLLGRHPHIEAQLHEEVDGVLAGRPATYEDLPRLELTGRIIAETLRLWPPIWVVTRICTADTHLGQYLLPAGTSIVYSPYLVHRRADLYTDPDRFVPDRWQAARTPQSPSLREEYIPFGAGPRKCIGDRFALNTTTLTLATIASRWRLRPLPGRRVRPTIGGPALSPGGLRMRVTARS